MWGQESLQSWKLWQRGIYLIFQGLIFSEAESECDLLLEKKKLRQKIAEMFPHSLLTHSVPLLQMYGHLGWHLNLTMPASCTQEQKENLGQGSGSLIIFNVPSYLSHSMILWFYEADFWTSTFTSVPASSCPSINCWGEYSLSRLFGKASLFIFSFRGIKLVRQKLPP